MKTLEEQTAVEAYNYASKNTDGNHSMTKSINDFISGAQWERNRDKWISAKEQKPEGISILAVSSGVILVLTCINGEYFYGANKWCNEITHWMRRPNFPEPPKQKEEL